VGHGITASTATRQGIELVGAIAILFGGVVEETATAFKVFGVVLGAAGVDVAAKKGLGHSEFGDKGVGDGFAIRDRAARYIHIAGFTRNVLCGWAPFIQWVIKGAKDGFLVNIGGISAGRIKFSSCGKDHILGWHGGRNSGSAGDIVFADLYPRTKIFG
jgi:hypothetical protein